MDDFNETVIAQFVAISDTGDEYGTVVEHLVSGYSTQQCIRFTQVSADPKMAEDVVIIGVDQFMALYNQLRGH